MKRDKMFAPSLSFYTIGIIIMNLTTICYMLYKSYPLVDMLIIGFLYFMVILLTDIRGKAIGMFLATHSKSLKKFLQDK